MQTLELFAFEGAPSLGSPQPNMEPDEILSAVCYIVQRSAAAARARPVARSSVAMATLPVMLPRFAVPEAEKKTVRVL